VTLTLVFQFLRCIKVVDALGRTSVDFLAFLGAGLQIQKLFFKKNLCAEIHLGFRDIEVRQLPSTLEFLLDAFHQKFLTTV
jgi:hypothetical protein